jgi:predicted nucleic acid-binding protein
VSARAFLDTNILVYADDSDAGDKRDRAQGVLRDALVVRCAIAAGCKRLLSEDLQHGRVFDGVRIEDPFR